MLFQDSNSKINMYLSNQMIFFLHTHEWRIEKKRIIINTVVRHWKIIKFMNGRKVEANRNKKSIPDIMHSLCTLLIFIYNFIIWNSVFSITSYVHAIKTEGTSCSVRFYRMFSPFFVLTLITLFVWTFIIVLNSY